MELELCILLFCLASSLCVNLTYYVKDGQASNSLVANIAADAQLWDNVLNKYRNFISFSQLPGEKTDSSQLFNVTKTGKLYTAKTIDAEILCKYNMECFRMVDVAIHQKESFVEVLEIKIVIQDINEHQPEFLNKNINLEFSEGDREGMMKAIPNAIDRDIGLLHSQISYFLKNNNSNLFTLSVSKNMDGTSKLGIILREKLDRELKDSYQLQVIAKDGGHPPKEGVLNIQITVRDENDNSPIFSQNIYNVSIKDGYQRSMPIVTLSATDLDSGKNGKVMYQFSSKTSESARAYFKLNESTGEIWQLQKFPPGSKRTYKLFVKAKDGGNPSLSSVAMVLVNINSQENNPPDIDISFISKSAGDSPSISEGVKVDSFIAYVKVTDNDVGENGEISCHLHHDKLQLKNHGRKKYMLIIKKTIDRETKNNIDFTIVCQDRGSPPLKTAKQFSIQVDDVNDIQPEFIKDIFTFFTYENEEANFPIGFINATDEDLDSGGKLMYHLENSKQTHAFKISHLGFISTTQSLDREQQEIYKFKVFVKDNGIPPLNNEANVIIEVMDKNDNVPYFTFPSVNPFNLYVYYHPQSKGVITTLRASDRDEHVNAFLKYEILEGNDKHLFKVNPYTGLLSFSRTVYQNDAGLYTLNLVVKDSGTPVLSATTTLSLTLTVSNTTARMDKPEDTESDNRIHINLMIIIVVAAVIVSVAIVVSVIVCVVHKRNVKENQYGVAQDFVGERRPSGYVCEQASPKYDVPVGILSDQKQVRNTQTGSLRRDPHSIYKPGQSWKGSSSGVHFQNITPESYQGNLVHGNPQEFSVTRFIGKDQQHMVMSPDRFSEMSTMSSVTDSGHGCSEASTAHYETLPGLKTYIQEQMYARSNKSLPYSISRAKDSKTTNIINLKSTQVDNKANLNQPLPWNLPTRNSFTAYNKPLPKVPFS
ncbi:protocadherin beta-15-like isoform X1 [Octopus vulgaris]|uniref:Protocadherin beta-15-like isoform X1 n=1 Tax=Octopus vulgaris TaxID=6645 RepID=A0AA36BEW3_OCTVU|nr:protocadherin beta-15-like isoform X1 [Octopus vulgaris]